ncbi:MAG: transcriptional regulator [Hyphomonas sp.]|nr:LysR family transcriptional regulator [Hyphomonas sp.]MAH91720.1 transcriptional regulator [Hyphomonas sp.]OUX89946.1 MAG: hypothetical protein CBB91_00885 [Hyphomonas sp. TMED31]
MDRFSSLTVFRRVVERGSFSAAARDLNYSNAAVSKMVKDLEAELGAQLIVRTTRSLHLTEIGQTYFDQVSDLLDGLAAADEQVRADTGTPRGRLRIAAPMSFGLATVAHMLPRFAARYPDIRIDLVMNDQFVDLVDGGFDLAIRGGALADSSLRARKLLDIRRILCAAPDYLSRHTPPATPKDLVHHACLVYSGAQSPDIWHVHNGADQAAIPVRSVFRANSSLAVREAARSGLGIALVPDLYVRDALSSGDLVRILPDWDGAPHALFALYPAHREQSLKHRLLIDFLVEEFAGLTSARA